MIASVRSGAEDNSFLAGGGQVGAMLRAKDWSATPLGSPESWPPSVKTATSLCLNSRFPIVLWLGQELRIVYNDAYVPFLGAAKHPAMLGAPGREAWGEIWDAIGPMLDEVGAGRATWVEDFQLFFSRNLPREEVYVTFSYSPIFDEARHVEGVFCVCTETTARVIDERRLSTLHGLGVRVAQQDMVETACLKAAETLDANPQDIAFAAIYLVETNGETIRRVAGTRLPASDVAPFPLTDALSATGGLWPFPEAARTGKAVDIPDLPGRIGAFAAPLWPDLVQTAIVLALPMPGQTAPAGYLVVGLSPRRVLDQGYRRFLDLVAEQIGSAVAEARSFEVERRRAEALAELDRAKTAFFSNVSHEFRTPLTLMLGPLEELLAKGKGDLAPDSRELIGVAHRNGLRLLRLVNTLLDFSRIEAGRVQATYEPTDLARTTVELAASFESACDRAGLAFETACATLPEPVYVDRDMWEKIVLNLLSNAFKFTFRGGIRVSLQVVPGGAELRVADTGVGIPAAELPRVFERFHRIDGQDSRSHEGSGIGLALVQELVRIHQGQIHVESEVGLGTTFSVVLPFGTTHLPQERIGAPRSLSVTSTGTAAYVEEALRWLPGEDRVQVGADVRDHPSAADPLAERKPAVQDALVLLADDNADMRDYLARLLSTSGWTIEPVANGEAALAAARLRRPDLVLADVMMPGLNGLELTKALRQEAGLVDVPVILLSARAGEKARVAGFESGADDYLFKPFVAHELVARVTTQLALSRLRREAAESVRRSETRLRAAVDLVGLCLYAWDPVTDALQWDDRLRAIWGLPAGAPVDINIFFAGIHPDDRKRVAAAIEHCRDPAGDGLYRLQYRVVGIGDGVERWVSTYGQTFFEKGQAVDFVGVALDVTERERARAHLQASEERFRRFAEHSTDVLWMLSVGNSEVEYLSPAFERVWGEPVLAMVGSERERWMRSIHPDDRDRASELLDRAKSGEGSTVEYRIVRPDGAVRWIRDTSFPILDEAGQILRIGGIAQDMTQHDGALVYVVGSDEASRAELASVLQGFGYQVKTFDIGRSFLEVAAVLRPGCIVLDFCSLGPAGFAIARELKARHIELPIISLGHPQDVTTAVQAMKAGAVDWLEARGDPAILRGAVASALAGIRDREEGKRSAALARGRIASMSSREREVLAGIMAGETNKSIARRLGISPRTIEIHRAHVMEQLGVRTLSEAVLMASAAGFAPASAAGTDAS